MIKKLPLNTVLPAFALAAFVGAAPAAAATQDEISNYTKPDRQQMLEEGAKKEGAMVWYCSLRVDVGCRPVQDAFMKKYPFIKADHVAGQAEQIMQRSLAEARAKNVHVDVMTSSIADNLVGTDIPQKFTTPEAAAFDPQMIDKNGMWAQIRNTWNGIAWNTTRISSAEAPQNWEDLINPKYKDKLFWQSGLAQGAPRVITHFRLMWGEDKALEFMKKLQANNVRTAPGDAGAMVVGLLSGEYTIMVGQPIHQIAPDKVKGAPVDGTNPDPALAKSSAMALLKGAPHPHAAMLFVDFILSEDGQKELGKAGYNPTRKGVSPLPENAWFQPNLNGKREIALPTNEDEKMYPKSLEYYQTMFRG